MPKVHLFILFKRELIRNEHHLEEIIQNLVRLGEELGKPVVRLGMSTT